MKKLLTLAAAMMLTSGLAWAQDLKIGSVDMQQIMQKAVFIKTANADLEKQFKPRQEKLAAQDKEFKAAVDKFNSNQAKMSAQERTDAQNKLIEQRNNLQKAMVSFQQDLGNAKSAAMQKFSAKFNEVLSGIAQSGNYDLIVQKQTTPYVAPKYDITGQVLNILDKK
jgi:outer membrane protein